MTCTTCGKKGCAGQLCRRCATKAANNLELTGGQWCYDPRSHVRRWVRDLVAQTFDEGALWPAISSRLTGTTQDVKRPDRECANTSTGPITTAPDRTRSSND